MSETYNYREKKTVAVLAKNLEPGVALNVLGHMAIRLGVSGGEDMMGRSTLKDASGTSHAGISRYPVIVTAVKSGTVRKAITLARENNALIAIGFPQQMLDTGHDDELAVAMLAASEESLNYLGVLIYGNAADVDAITGKYSLWKP